MSAAQKLAVLITILLHANAIAAEVVVLPELTTTKGKKYVNVKVREVTPAGLRIMHDLGVRFVPFSELPDELKKRFGYDAEAEEKYKKEQAAAEEEQQAAMKKAALARWATLPVEQRYSITPSSADGIELTYRDYHFLATEKRSLLERQLKTPKEIEASLAHIPKGGTLKVTVHRSTIGAANTEWFLVIVTDTNGNEISRHHGDDDIAETPIGDGKWWNLMLVDLPTEVTSSVRVRVVDKLSNSHEDFTLKRRP